MDILAQFYSMITSAFKMELSIYGYSFSFWDMILFSVFAPLIVRFLMMVMDAYNSKV